MKEFLTTGLAGVGGGKGKSGKELSDFSDSGVIISSKVSRELAATPVVVLTPIGKDK